MVDVQAVSKTYRRGRVDVSALRDVTFRVAAGEAVAIMGPLTGDSRRRAAC